MNPDEKTIIVMNHRTRVDWNYVWIALYHATKDPSKTDVCICKEDTSNRQDNDILDVLSGGKSKIKFVLKDELKAIPGMGKCNGKSQTGIFNNCSNIILKISKVYIYFRLEYMVGE